MEHVKFKCCNMRKKVRAAGENPLCFSGWILLTFSEIRDWGKELEFFCNATEASISLKLSYSTV